MGGRCPAVGCGRQAKVSPEEDARLGRDLTPNGAERAASKDGSIPDWNLPVFPAAAPALAVQPRLEASPETSKDKPLYVVTAANMAQYKGQLTAGQEALLKRFPDSYKLNVYTIRGTGFRDPKKWAASLDAMRALQAEVMVPSHTRPLIGAALVADTLRDYRDAIL